MNAETKNSIILCWNANPLMETCGVAKAIGCDETDVDAVIREYCSPRSIAWRECIKRRRLSLAAIRTTQQEFLAERKSPEYVGRTTNWSGRGPGWEAAKKATLQRDSNTCQICGMTKDLQGRNMDVHHRKPFYSILDREQANHQSNLICLCRYCHSSAERENLVLPSKLTG